MAIHHNSIITHDDGLTHDERSLCGMFHKTTKPKGNTFVTSKPFYIIRGRKIYQEHQLRVDEGEEHTDTCDLLRT